MKNRYTLAERAKEYGEQFKDAPESPEVSRGCAWLVGYLAALEDAAVIAEDEDDLFTAAKLRELIQSRSSQSEDGK